MQYLRCPPAFALAAALSILTIGALSGAVLVILQDTLYSLARREIIKRPDVHGFAGTEVIDERRISEVADQSNIALRLLHTHALGVGILIFIATLVIANLPLPPRMQAVVCAMVSLGAIYPLGWLALAWLIPYWGVERLRAPVEWLFFAPFGGLLVAGLCLALGCYVIGMLTQAPKP
jgi:hypothetical protein